MEPHTGLELQRAGQPGHGRGRGGFARGTWARDAGPGADLHCSQSSLTRLWALLPPAREGFRLRDKPSKTPGKQGRKQPGSSPPPGTRPTEQPLWSSAPAAMSDGSSQKAPTEPRVQLPSPSIFRAPSTSDPANPIQPRGGHVTLAWTTGGPHPLVTVIGSRWPRRGQAASSES